MSLEYYYFPVLGYVAGYHGSALSFCDKAEFHVRLICCNIRVVSNGGHFYYLEFSVFVVDGFHGVVCLNCYVNIHPILKTETFFMIFFLNYLSDPLNPG